MLTRITCATKISLILAGILACPMLVQATDFGNLMILGDSITQAQGNGTTATPLNGRNSYRYQLWKCLVDNHATFDMVGSHDINRGVSSFYPTYKGLNFDRDNEGHWAWDTDDVLNGTEPATIHKWKRDAQRLAHRLHTRHGNRSSRFKRYLARCLRRNVGQPFGLRDRYTTSRQSERPDLSLDHDPAKRLRFRY